MVDIKRVTDRFSFRTASISLQDTFYIIASNDELQTQDLVHTHIFELDLGQRHHELLKWSASSSCIVDFPKRQMVAIDEHGHVRVHGSEESFDEQIGHGADHPEKRGPLREVRTIAGRAYACGMDRQVYRRDAPHAWTCIDLDMRQAPAAMDVFGFESIHGFGESDIYAVGWHGEIWHFDGRKWSQIESPTNLILTKVFCAEDENVYICGQQGMLI